MRIWVHTWGPVPLILEGQKRPKFGAISDNFRFRQQLSPERIDISTSGKRRYKLRPSHVDKKTGEF